MRKINVCEFISLDGVIQDPRASEEDTSGPPGWIRAHADAVSSAAVQKQMNIPFDLLLGRRTFELWARFWPQHGDMWPAVMTATKYVASNTMTSHEWRPSVFLSGDIAEKITRIKQQEGPDLHVCGSANLVQTLMKHDLVDAFWLMIFPVTLGPGKRLFAEGTVPAAFKVTESTVTSKGALWCITSVPAQSQPEVYKHSAGWPGLFADSCLNLILVETRGPSVPSSQFLHDFSVRPGGAH